MLPPYLLTSDSFQNWRGMQQSGGRRVMRSVSIDMTSVRFCTPEMLDRYRRIDLIRDYIDRTEQRIERYNAEHGIAACERRINGLHQTNLGIFRAYLVRYLQQEVPVNRSHDPDGAADAADRDRAADAALFLYRYGGVGGVRGHPVRRLRPCAGRDPDFRPEGLPESLERRSGRIACGGRALSAVSSGCASVTGRASASPE